MKKIAILLSVLSMALTGMAQEKSTTKHMVITIENNYLGGIVIGKASKANNMFITRDDTAQVEKYVDLKLRVKSKEQTPSRENQLMQLIEPYYNEGWKLVSTSVEVMQPTTTETFRYYLVKE